MFCKISGPIFRLKFDPVQIKATRIRSLMVKNRFLSVLVTVLGVGVGGWVLILVVFCVGVFVRAIERSLKYLPLLINILITSIFFIVTGIWTGVDFDFSSTFRFFL